MLVQIPCRRLRFGDRLPAAVLQRFAIILALLALAGAAWAAERQSLVTASDEVVIDKLKRELDWKLEAIPLREVAEHIRKLCAVNVWIEAKALKEVGVDEDAPLTFHGSKVPAEVALDRMLEAVELTWTVYDGLLVITSPEVAETQLSVRVYNVRDLLAKSINNGGWTDYDFDSLIELITGNVSPNTWDAVGGPGSIHEYNNDFEVALVISQTHEVHREIDELFCLLRHLPVRSRSHREKNQRSSSSVDARGARSRSSSEQGGLRRSTLAPAWPPGE